jgi:RNA polymerase sigma factor (sigma-70 family)
MNDAALWNSWRTERDPDAFAQIAARYAGLVFGTCRRVLRNSADAEDASQECFLELLRVDLREPQSLGPFLHTLAVRRALDLAKSERRREAREARFAREKPDAHEVSADELTGCVDAAIAELPDELRVPLVARFLEGLTYDVIAARLRVPKSTARHRIGRGIDALRAVLVRRGVTVPVGSLAAILGGLSAEAASPALLAQLGKLALAGAATGTTAAGALSSDAILLGALAMKKVHVVALLSVLAAILGTVLVYRGVAPSRSRGATPPLAVGRDALIPRDGDHGADGPPEAVTLITPTPPGATLKGHVRDAGSGEPLAGASARAGGLEATSDTTGRFSFAGLPAGSVELAVSLRGFVASHRQVELGAGGEAAVDFVLEPAMEVLAEVASGRAIEGAEVYVHETSDAAPAGEEHGPFVTGADGKTFVDGVPLKRRGAASWSSRTVFARRGVDAVLTGIATQHIQAPADGSAVFPASPLRVVLVDSVLVAGRVEVPPGRDPRDALVSVHGVAVRDPHSFLGPTLARPGGEGDRPWPQLFEVHPDLDARFELAWVPRASRVMVYATGPGLGQAMFQSDDPRALGDVILTLPPEGVIEGTLAFEGTGAPAAGWRLVAMSQSLTPGRDSTLTREVGLDGRFRFEGLPADAYRLALPHDADRSEWTLGRQEPVLVRSGETVRGIELRLEKGAIVRGQVTDASNGMPVSGVWVSAVQGPEEPGVPQGGAVTGEGGRYEMRLPRGHSSLYLSSLPEGFRRIPGGEKHVVEIAAGEVDRAGMDFEVSPGAEPLPAFLERFEALGQAAGRVIDASGAPLAHAAIEAHRQWILEEDAKKGPWINPTHRAFTDEDGRYEVPVVAGKPYKVLATGAEYSTAWSEVFRVEEGGKHVVEDLRLVRGTSSLEGVVVDADGRGIEGADLFATSKTKEARSGQKRVATDSRGRFQLQHLLEGELVNLAVVRAGYETRKWIIAPGSSDLRLVLPACDEGNRAGEKKSLPEPRDLIGKRAPFWSVERWIREPLAPALLDRPERSDQKTTVVVLPPVPSDWDESRRQAEALEAVCERQDAAAVVIFSSAIHESAVLPHFSGLGPRVAVGMDRFVPRSEHEPGDATRIAYGHRGSLTIIVVEPGGTVTHVVHDLEALEEALRR